MIKLTSNNEEVAFTTTTFPDGTSQVWKVDAHNLDRDGDNVILWLFESESELLHICQLLQLLKVHFDVVPDLYAPYLPYGRQDKEISNGLSFALTTMRDILYNVGCARISTFDAHSNTDMIYSNLPTDFHRSVVNHGVICFPDKGAAKRYGDSIAFRGIPAVYCEKVRDQLTGEITGLSLVGDAFLSGQDVLIVDDICDGGMTFIKVAEELKKFNPNTIDLCVSHGLFSKGQEVLHEAGINKIFTTNSLLRNPEGYKVW